MAMAKKLEDLLAFVALVNFTYKLHTHTHKPHPFAIVFQDMLNILSKLKTREIWINYFRSLLIFILSTTTRLISECNGNKFSVGFIVLADWLL